jgi:hypothetical protein
MELLRFAGSGKPRLNVLDGDRIVTRDSLATEYRTMLSIVAGGDAARTGVSARSSSLASTCRSA